MLLIAFLFFWPDSTCATASKHIGDCVGWKECQRFSLGDTLSVGVCILENLNIMSPLNHGSFLLLSLLEHLTGDIPYFSDYKMYFSPQVWEETGARSYSLNLHWWNIVIYVIKYFTTFFASKFFSYFPPLKPRCVLWFKKYSNFMAESFFFGTLWPGLNDHVLKKWGIVTFVRPKSFIDKDIRSGCVTFSYIIAECN